MSNRKTLEAASVIIILILILALLLPSAAGAAAPASVAPTVRATLGPAATKLAPTLKALTPKGTVTPVATLSPAEASEAITTYASKVLGLTITVKKAGGLSYEVTKNLTQTSSSSTAQSAVAKLAVKTYGGTFGNGAAALSYGKGTISGDVNVDVQGASLGVYTIAATSSGSLNADLALALARQTFPGIADRNYAPKTVSKGYAWYAKGSVKGMDPATKKATVLAEGVLLYVLPGANGKVAVTATVGRGDFASQVKAP
jgi:hypothetical protein